MGFMRIGNFKAQPDKVDELIRIYQNEAIPIIKQAPGNIGAFILQKKDENNIFLACTVWETKEDAEIYDKSGQAIEIINKVKHTFDGPPNLTTYNTFGI
jgi:heme-degrading monooxygenase HmoA